jgi:predicted AlkP superfamily pyrophosphatase or phosphodiesterase
MRKLSRVLVLALLLTATLASARVKTLVVISIDGLKPEYVTQAEKHDLKVPNLHRFVVDGTYADGVVGVVPTVTYSSHTTLMTGVWPAEHGIVTNTPFDPFRKNQDGWYWYASDIKVPTLWQAASDGGVIVASLNWPVSVDAAGVKYLIPEYWRARTPEDRGIMEAISRPLGWLQELEKQLGPYVDDYEKVIDADVMRTRFAVTILRDKRPGLMTIHLVALDHAQHETSPFSEESNKTLETLDKMVGEIEGAVNKIDPDAVIAIVSDHGFVRTDYRINLMLPFIDAGLVTVSAGSVSKKAQVKSWDAMLWSAGGSAAVVLRNPDDAALKAKVQDLLKKMQADPQYGIARVLSQPEIKQLGGFPDVAFLIDMRLDYQPTSELDRPLMESIPSTGMHGYLPEHQELNSSFFIRGKGIAAGRDLGIIDMRQICPTLAGLLGVAMPTAKQKPVDVH